MQQSDHGDRDLVARFGNRAQPADTPSCQSGQLNLDLRDQIAALSLTIQFANEFIQFGELHKPYINRT